MKPIYTFIVVLFIASFSNARDLTAPLSKTRAEQFNESSKPNEDVLAPNESSSDTSSEKYTTQQILFSNSTTKLVQTKQDLALTFNTFDQCDKYFKLKRAGGYTMLGGGIVTIAGIATSVVGLSVMVSTFGFGGHELVIYGAGALLTGSIIFIIGSILKIVGNIQYNKNCFLQLHSSGNNIVLTYHL